MILRNCFNFKIRTSGLFVSLFFLILLIQISTSLAAVVYSVDKDDKAITVSSGDQNILSYYHAIHPVPKGIDPAYRRSGFIHPLYSPSGKVLTRIQPPDHYHHYGIWAPWTKVTIEGKVVDFWNLAKKQGTVRFAELISKDSQSDSASFKVRQEHVQFLPDGKERVVISEILQITASSDTLNNKPIWIIDISSQLENILDSDVIFDKYRYGGGLGFRATEQWSGDNCTVLTSEGKTRSDADASRARWCDVNGSFPGTDQTSGILFLSHPDNLQHPEPMRVWNEKMMGGKGNMFFEFCPIRKNSFKLESGKTNTLKYRMVVYDGKLSKYSAESLWQDYASPKQTSKNVLIYTKNGKGFVHKNIPASIAGIKKICNRNGWSFEATDDPAIFTTEKISKFDVLVFSNTNNETFDTDAQKKVFQQYIRSGGGFVAIHSACASERKWPWYWANVGCKFVTHPKFQKFDVKVLDKNHPSTEFLPDVWKWEDECYIFDHLSPNRKVLLSADLRTVDPKNKKMESMNLGDSSPLCWTLQFEGGRQWYTALGHAPEHFDDETYLRHIEGGIKWAMDLDK